MDQSTSESTLRLKRILRDIRSIVVLMWLRIWELSETWLIVPAFRVLSWPIIATRLIYLFPLQYTPLQLIEHVTSFALHVIEYMVSFSAKEETLELQRRVSMSTSIETRFLTNDMNRYELKTFNSILKQLWLNGMSTRVSQLFAQYVKRVFEEQLTYVPGLELLELQIDAHKPPVIISIEVLPGSLSSSEKCMFMIVKMHYSSNETSGLLFKYTNLFQRQKIIKLHQLEVRGTASLIFSNANDSIFPFRTMTMSFTDLPFFDFQYEKVKKDEYTHTSTSYHPLFKSSGNVQKERNSGLLVHQDRSSSASVDIYSDEYREDTYSDVYSVSEHSEVLLENATMTEAHNIVRLHKEKIPEPVLSEDAVVNEYLEGEQFIDESQQPQPTTNHILLALGREKGIQSATRKHFHLGVLKLVFSVLKSRVQRAALYPKSVSFNI